MQQAEEDLLTLAAQDGDEEAFAMIHHRYHSRLVKYAYKVIGDVGLAQDAVQEAWIKLARNLRQLDDPRALRSWLYQLVHWSSMDMLRRNTRHASGLTVFDENEHGSAVESDQKSGNETLRASLDRLPAVEKQIIQLFYLNELRINEIAHVLTIPAGTVKSRLNRARKLLKERYVP